MKDLSELKTRLMIEGEMSAENAEAALKFLIDNNMSLGMVDLLIAKRKGVKDTEVLHIEISDSDA